MFSVFMFHVFCVLIIMLVVDVHEFNVSFSFAFVNCHSVKNCVFVNCELLVLRLGIVKFYI
jgi:hypothetical protein